MAVAGEPGLDLIDTIEGYEALVISPDGSRRWTKRFPIAAAGAALLPEHRDQHVPSRTRPSQAPGRLVYGMMLCEPPNLAER
jgi:hypothetical protein